jgi:outer membrane protein OmpA-like peptidoglycan-associated protein
MKKVLIAVLFFAPAIFINAQIKVDLKNKIIREADRRANQKTDEAIDKAFNKAEEEVASLFKKKEKEQPSAQEKNQGISDNQGNQAETYPGNRSEEVQDAVQQQPALVWAKYDFVPGDKVIFEDIHENEQNGEFPARWDLVKGAGIENAVFDNSRVIYFRSGDALIVPYLKDPKSDYLPDVFTIEFDAWFEAREYCYYHLKLFDDKNQPDACNLVTISANAIYYRGVGGSTYPGEKHDDNLEKSYWRHIALSFNVRALKIYLDDARLVNIPNLECNPTGVTIGVPSFNSAGTKGINRFIKNIRIAEGGVKLYDRLLQDGKIVSNGIRFDVNKATLRPESMGVINTICQLMTEHPELRFSVEGHTDSDGDEASNQTLSEKRAETVASTLILMGIDSGRLISKGWGESKPVSDNSTPEGKANNRRVEFIKL